MNLFGDLYQAMRDIADCFNNLFDLIALLNDLPYPRKKLARKKLGGQQLAVYRAPRKWTLCIEYPTGFA